MFIHICYACFVSILARTSSLYLGVDKFDIREEVFITVKSIIVVFKFLFRGFWKFNISIKTISKTSLEPNYRIALIELEHRMQSYMSCIFVSILQIHVKFFRIPTLYVNNLELDNYVIIADKAGAN